MCAASRQHRKDPGLSALETQSLPWTHQEHEDSNVGSERRNGACLPKLEFPAELWGHAGRWEIWRARAVLAGAVNRSFAACHIGTCLVQPLTEGVNLW